MDGQGRWVQSAPVLFPHRLTRTGAADRKSTLVFCVNLAHVRDLTNVFREFGVDARYLHAGTPVNERKELVSAFRRGEFPVLVNCGELSCAARVQDAPLKSRSDLDGGRGYTQYRLCSSRAPNALSQCLRADGQYTPTNLVTFG